MPGVTPEEARAVVEGAAAGNVAALRQENAI